MSEELAIVKLTVKQALEMLPEDDGDFHMMRPAPFGIVGGDLDRDSAVKMIESASELQLAGQMACRMEHALAVHNEDGWVFLKTKKGIEANYKPQPD